jgi:hypothetical protein
MYSVSVCHVARNWVDIGSFHTRLVVKFMIFTESVRNILDFMLLTFFVRLFGDKGVR